MAVETQDSIFIWSEQQFPARNGHEAGIRAQALKLVSEACELALACGCTGREIDDLIVHECIPLDLGEYQARNLDLAAAPVELADVAVVSAVLAGRLGIDLGAEVDRKMKKNRARRWDVDPNGKAQHVK